MEGDAGQPMDFERLLSHLRATTAPGGVTDPSDDSRRHVLFSGDTAGALTDHAGVQSTVLLCCMHYDKRQYAMGVFLYALSD